jgi:hypothetical protein
MNTLNLADLAAAGLTTFDLAGRGTPHKPRFQPPMGVVVHTPGTPFAQRALAAATSKLGRAPSLVELDQAAAERFDVASYLPGYLIGQSGAVFRLESDDKRTMHAGQLGADAPRADVYAGTGWREWASPSDGSGWRRHGRPGDQVYDYWLAAFPGAETPVDVFPWGAYPNSAIGIDLLPDPATGAHTAAQRSSFVTLVRTLASVHRFLLDQYHVTTHTLASPVERGTVLRGGRIVGVHWDPDARRWPMPEVLAELRAGV